MVDIELHNPRYYTKRTIKSVPKRGRSFLAMTNDAIAEGCFEKIENAIAMLEKAACDIKLIKTHIEKDQMALTAGVTAVCSILAGAWDEIGMPEMLKLAACAGAIERWGQ